MIERFACVFFSLFAFSIIPALAQDTVPEIAESHGRIRRSRLLPPDEKSPLDSRQPKPEEILRWSLEMVHPEELDYAAMAKALAQQNGWTTNRFAECADVADDFLSRFDPDWPRCNARKLLLAKWKDDPSLSDFARNRASVS